MTSQGGVVRGLSEGLRTHATATTAAPTPMAGLRMEMRNGLGPFLVDVLERRAEVVSTMCRGGAPVVGLRAADQVFDDMSLRRKDANPSTLGGSCQVFDKMPLHGKGSLLRGLANARIVEATHAPGPTEDWRAKYLEVAARSGEIFTGVEEGGFPFLDVLLSNLRMRITLMPVNVDSRSHCAALFQGTVHTIDGIDVAGSLHVTTDGLPASLAMNEGIAPGPIGVAQRGNGSMQGSLDNFSCLTSMPDEVSDQPTMQVGRELQGNNALPKYVGTAPVSAKMGADAPPITGTNMEQYKWIGALTP